MQLAILSVGELNTTRRHAFRVLVHTVASGRKDEPSGERNILRIKTAMIKKKKKKRTESASSCGTLPQPGRGMSPPRALSRMMASGSRLPCA